MPSTQMIDTEWWRGAVIYQIYPRSFQDSSGDGVGDLHGIARRLDHVAKLGVDAVWISPFFTSPMQDFGYDISDYRDVDPLFGTLADFDALIARAHELGLKVIIDLVLSHTSDQHPWFVESRQTRHNPRADWYVWADPKPDGTAPNNWLSFFGGSSWQWDSRRCQYYLHNFLVSQPDLNFHNPHVQEAVLDVARFWLDRGVDGFRLDTINFYFHDKLLRDNPALPPESRNDKLAPAVNPYNHQLHIYSKNQPENLDFIKRLRTLMEGYPGTAMVGEVGEAQRGLEILGEYTSGGDKAHMCYAFEMLAHDQPTAQRVADVMAHVDAVASAGWACWAFSNHDVVRHVSRWGLSPLAARAYVAMLICLRGSVCLYQGEELGLPEADVAYEDLQDPYGREFWPEFKGRDGCRTPMVWDAQAVNGGFSEARPWLPVSPVHLGLAVSLQEHDPASMFGFYRRAIQMRRRMHILKDGRQTPVEARGDVLVFERYDDEHRVFVAVNLGEHPQAIAAPEGDWSNVAADLGGVVPRQGVVELDPWGICILWRE